MGRQDRGEEGPYTLLPKAGQSRLILAKFDEDKISRKHVLVEPLAGGYLKLTNLSKTLSVPIQNGSDLTEEPYALMPQASHEVPLPAVFILGTKTVRVQGQESEAGNRAFAECESPSMMCCPTWLLE